MNKITAEKANEAFEDLVQYGDLVDGDALIGEDSTIDFNGLIKIVRSYFEQQIQSNDKEENKRLQDIAYPRNASGE